MGRQGLIKYHEAKHAATPAAPEFSPSLNTRVFGSRYPWDYKEAPPRRGKSRQGIAERIGGTEALPHWSNRVVVLAYFRVRSDYLNRRQICLLGYRPLSPEWPSVGYGGRFGKYSDRQKPLLVVTARPRRRCIGSGPCCGRVAARNAARCRSVTGPSSRSKSAIAI